MAVEGAAIDWIVYPVTKVAPCRRQMGHPAKAIMQSIGLSEQSAIAARIVGIAEALGKGSGISTVYCLDFRIGDDESVTLLVFEVCLGLPSFDARFYVRMTSGMSVPEALAKTAARLLASYSHL